MATSKTADNRINILSLGIANRLAEILSSVDDDELAEVPMKLKQLSTAAELLRLRLEKATDSNAANELTTEVIVALSEALSTRLKVLL